MTLRTDDFRRAVSAAANGAKCMVEALQLTKNDQRAHLMVAADECIDALAALALGQIRRTP